MPAGKRRSASFRAVSFRGTCATCLLATLLASTAVYVTARLASVRRETSGAPHPVDRGADLERLALLYTREVQLSRAPRDGGGRPSREGEVLRQLEDGLGALHEHPANDAEKRLAERVERHVRAHVAGLRGIAREGRSLPDLAERSRETLDAVIGSLRELRAFDAAQLDRRHRKEARLRQVATGLEIAAALAILALGIASVRMVARDVLGPLQRIVRAVDGFLEGDVRARAGSQRLSEIDHLASGVDALLETTHRANEERLASLGAVAHDLRNPLGTLQLSIESLRSRERPIPEDTLDRALATALRQIERLSRMVSDLVDAVRIESGNLEIKTGRLDLCEPVAEVVREFEAAAKDHRIESHLPREPVMTEADRDRICQVIENLLSNAIKYSPEGGRIDVTLERKDGEAVLSIADQGVGIPEDELKTIFIPFRRGTKPPDADGVGLGLSVARHIVRAHGGRIAVESTEGEGSTFRVHLPSGSGEA